MGREPDNIDLTIAQRAEATGPVDPAFITAVSALQRRRVKFRVLNMKHFDPITEVIEKGQVVELLQHEMRRVKQNAATRVMINGH